MPVSEKIFKFGALRVVPSEPVPEIGQGLAEFGHGALGFSRRREE